MLATESLDESGQTYLQRLAPGSENYRRVSGNFVFRTFHFRPQPQQTILFGTKAVYRLHATNSRRQLNAKLTRAARLLQTADARAFGSLSGASSPTNKTLLNLDLNLSRRWWCAAGRRYRP